ncbi:MAG: cupin domain-containing protein [Pseudomonadota bacterium]|nr:cupin domain-containing protein [Pseudomonadota bacterium]
MTLRIDWQGLSAEQFLSEYWQKKPLFIKQAVPDIEHLLTGDDLAGLAIDEDIESRVILQQPVGEFHLKRGPFEEDYFFSLNDSHWTLLVQAVDQFLPELSQLMSEVHFLPNWRLDDVMVSFATPGGSVGPHFDQYDVFLIQGSGSRRWATGQQCDDKTALIPHPEIKLLANFAEQAAYDCEPGDLLYLPPGLAHHGVATSNHCMTYSIGARAPSWRYMLEILMDDFLQNIAPNDLYSDPKLKQAAAGQFNPELIMPELRKRASEYLQSEQASDTLSRLLSEPKYDGYQTQATHQPLPVADLQWDLGSRALYTTEPFALHINGENISTDEVDLAKALCDQKQFSAQWVAQHQDSTLLQTLWAKGLLFEIEPFE